MIEYKVSRTLSVGNLRRRMYIQIEIVNEFGKRMLAVAARDLAGEKKTNFKFKAMAFPTGKYVLRVIGEAFTAEQSFYILN